MRRANDISDEGTLSRPLRIARRGAMTLIGLSTAMLLVVTIKDRFVDHDLSSKPTGRRSESPVKKQAWPHPGYLV